MADTSVVYLNADFVGFGGSDFDVLNGEVFASLPGHSSLVVVSDGGNESATGMYLARDGLVGSLSVSVFIQRSGAAYLSFSIGRHCERLGKSRSQK